VKNQPFNNTVTLNEVTDELNTVIAEFETFLKQKSFGVTASIEVLVPDSDIEESFYLGYGKMGTEWRLFYQAHSDALETHLTSMSRKYRVLGTDKLPELYRLLVETADDQTEGIRMIVDRVRSFIKENS
jgi:hypothetical protein